MQKLVAFVATVAVVCVALVEGQATLVLQGFTDAYPVPQALQTPCATLTAAFKTTWETPAHACNAIAAQRDVWSVYRAGATLTSGTFDIKTTTDLTDCTNKVTDADAGDQAAATAMCSFLGEIVAACSCARMKCVTDLVNTQVAATACNTLAQGACNFFSAPATDSDKINFKCNAAVGRTLTGWAAGQLPRSCPTDNCAAASFGVTTTGPPGPTNTGRAPTTTRTGGAAGVSSGVYLAAVALGAAAVL